jgi:hypothetical protein
MKAVVCSRAQRNRMAPPSRLPAAGAFLAVPRGRTGACRPSGYDGQDLAVTGSVNQLGQMQPTGGVNEQVEGFFDICRAKELRGAQGVMIPAASVQNLMLREEVIDAVRQGQFHIWAVRTVAEESRS